MADEIDRQSLKQLVQIEENLEEIKERTPTGKRAFILGMIQGAGAIIGSILAITLLGFLLSLFGVIPGFVDIAHYLQGVLNTIHR